MPRAFKDYRQSGLSLLLSWYSGPIYLEQYDKPGFLWQIYISHNQTQKGITS